jgi:hypothetical protein
VTFVPSEFFAVFLFVSDCSLLLTLAATCLANFANAAIVSADFKNTVDLPYIGFSVGPIVFQATSVSVGAGIEFNAINPIANPSGWTPGRVAVDIDPLTNIAFNAGETITGFTQLTNNLVTPVYSPTLTFTGNSLNVYYDSGSAVNTDSFDFSQGNSATFQITTSTGTVPVPASIALIAGGLFLMRQKAKK